MLTNYFATWSGLEVADQVNALAGEGLDLSLSGMFSIMSFVVAFVQANFVQILSIVVIWYVAWYITVHLVRKFRGRSKGWKLS